MGCSQAMLDAGYKRRTHPAAGLLLAAIGVLVIQCLDGERASAARAHASKALTIAKKTFRLSQPDQKRRLTVRCPGQLIPFGGGMASNPTPDTEGEGTYPHSYERLGVQSGFHSTVVMFDPTPASTQPRDVTLQVVCGRKGKHVTPPHTTVNVGPGQVKTAVATCPGRRHLFGGGFQRTDFLTGGGNYVTDSHAVSSKSWSVTGSAFGSFGGERIAIAYCRRSKNPLVTEVSDSTMVPPGKYATAVTPSCPPGTRIVSGGFGSSPAGPVLLTDGFINTLGGWTASGFNYFGRSAATVTAYGYCMKV
jgi:hypothetical protein